MHQRTARNSSASSPLARWPVSAHQVGFVQTSPTPCPSAGTSLPHVRNAACQFLAIVRSDPQAYDRRSAPANRWSLRLLTYIPQWRVPSTTRILQACQWQKLAHFQSNFQFLPTYIFLFYTNHWSHLCARKRVTEPFNCPRILQCSYKKRVRKVQ